MSANATRDFWPPDSCCISLISPCLPVNDTWHTHSQLISCSYLYAHTNLYMFSYPDAHSSELINAGHAALGSGSSLAICPFTLVLRLTAFSVSLLHHQSGFTARHQFLKHLAEVLWHLRSKQNIRQLQHKLLKRQPLVMIYCILIDFSFITTLKTYYILFKDIHISSDVYLFEGELYSFIFA